jgi:hypothetical protein
MCPQHRFFAASVRVRSRPYGLSVFDGNVWRAIAVASAAASLAIGLATIGAAIATSFADAAPVGLSVLGAAMVVVVTTCYIQWSVQAALRHDRKRLLDYVSSVLMWLLLAYGLIAFRRSTELHALGGGFLVLAVVMASRWARAAKRRHDASRRVCPDCAETIRADANVCRYCGFRFRPAPSEDM